LTKPFLNWSGKAERQHISVPTLPLFVHERHSTQAIQETLRDHRARGTNLDLFGDAKLDIADRLDAPIRLVEPWWRRSSDCRDALRHGWVAALPPHPIFGGTRKKPLL